MLKLSLALPETRQIEINGEIFNIKKSDIDILKKSRRLTEKYSKIKENDDSAENLTLITAGANEMIKFINQILGTGAVSKISQGLPVSIVTACNWLTEICRAITDSDGDAGEKYAQA